MKVPPQLLLLHPVFLLSLTLLLSNDLFLKYEFHNGFTGKLSDFAGLFAFAVFFIAFFPRQKKHIIMAVSIFFTWWKSALSNSFILFINEYLSLPVARVIDYTDYFALFVLPFAYSLKPIIYPSSVMRSVALYAAGTISLFAFCATSIAPRQLMYHPYRENEISFKESFDSPLNETEILKRLNAENHNYGIDSVKFYKINEPGTFYQRVKDKNDSASRWLPLVNNADTAIFLKKETGIFYIIPQYLMNGDTLLNLEVHIGRSYQKKKPARITIESFQVKSPSAYKNYYSGSLQKKYRKHFKRIFRK